MEPEEKSRYTNKQVLIGVMLFVVIFFSGILISRKIDGVSERANDEMAFEQMADSVAKGLYIKTFHPGQVFLPKDRSFSLPFMVDFNVAMVMPAEEVLFMGSPNNGPDEAAMVVCRFPFDTTLTITENWSKQSNDPSVMAFTIVNNEALSKDTAILDLISNDSTYTSIVRVERKESLLYTVTAQSRTKSWSKYKEAFRYSIKNFKLMDRL